MATIAGTILIKATAIKLYLSRADIYENIIQEGIRKEL